MLIYPKTKKGVQKDSPVWKEDNFLRLRGLADALVHKTDFKTEDGKNVLAGAYYERVRRELETLEAAKLAQLSKSLGPKAAALKAMPEPTGGRVKKNFCWFMAVGASRAAFTPFTNHCGMPSLWLQTSGRARVSSTARCRAATSRASDCISGSK